MASPDLRMPVNGSVWTFDNPFENDELMICRLIL